MLLDQCSGKARIPDPQLVRDRPVQQITHEGGLGKQLTDVGSVQLQVFEFRSAEALQFNQFAADCRTALDDSVPRCFLSPCQRVDKRGTGKRISNDQLIHRDGRKSRRFFRCSPNTVHALASKTCTQWA